MKVKLAYLGGASAFVPSILNGVGQVLRASQQPYEVEVSLYDIHPEKAERMSAYARLLADAWRIPLTAPVAASREAALEGAKLALASVWLEEEHRRIDRLWQQLGFRPHDEGPGLVAWALACAPWSLGVAEDMRRFCPDARFVTLMNPTDLTAGLVAEVAKIPAAGMCVEVDGLRGALAYYFQVPFDSIRLVHAGVNHDGWVLDLRVDDQDGYQMWKDRWPLLEQDADFHPGNRGMIHIQRLTGHLRSSGYHNWPLQIYQTPEDVTLWDRWRGKREIYASALEEALGSAQPISDPPGIHPERSRLNYPYTGLAVGRWMHSLATGVEYELPLQVHNLGAIANFPADSIVEVPVTVCGQAFNPLHVGELPEWLGGVTRLQAIQRRLFIDYLQDRRLDRLKQALSVLPLFLSIQQANLYAETLHDCF